MIRAAEEDEEAASASLGRLAARLGSECKGLDPKESRSPGAADAVDVAFDIFASATVVAVIVG